MIRQINQQHFKLFDQVNKHKLDLTDDLIHRQAKKKHILQEMASSAIKLLEQERKNVELATFILNNMESMMLVKEADPSELFTKKPINFKSRDTSSSELVGSNYFNKKS
jgi:hypothetical protein